MCLYRRQVSFSPPGFVRMPEAEVEAMLTRAPPRRAAAARSPMSGLRGMRPPSTSVISALCSTAPLRAPHLGADGRANLERATGDAFAVARRRVEWTQIARHLLSRRLPA